jgi:hypothetical protein
VANGFYGCGGVVIIETRLVELCLGYLHVVVYNLLISTFVAFFGPPGKGLRRELWKVGRC